MSAKVFISCGQGTEEERLVANSVKDVFRELGYQPYVAVNVQTIFDLNSGIVQELKSSDMYLFINFRREHLRNGVYRGSLFSNQELAIAYAPGFEKVLILNQEGVESEGMLRYIVSNTPRFSGYGDVVPTLRNTIAAAAWTPQYTRQLAATGLDSTGQYVTYGDGAEHWHVRIFYIDVRNGRPDVGAVGAVARLASIRFSSGTALDVTDHSQLKATGHPGFEQVILPESHGRFDLFGIEDPKRFQGNGPRVFLHSALDLHPRVPIIQGPGDYVLEFEAFSQGFPRLAFVVNLSLAPDPFDSVATLA